MRPHRTLAPRGAPALLFALAACVAPRANSGPGHGELTTLSVAGEGARACEHAVPAEVCTRCHPELAARFEAAGDWCGPHAVPESQCFECHPDLTFEPLPALPPGADLALLATRGEDVGALEAHAVPGKVTVFDFFAAWCAGCRKLDLHLRALLATRPDLAVRRLDVVDWESPLARRHLAGIERLPYVVVIDRSGRRVRGVVGVDLDELDRAIAEGAGGAAR